MRPPRRGGAPQACLRFSVAALFELPIRDVPDFVELYGRRWSSMLSAWMRERGYEISFRSFKKGSPSWPKVRQRLPRGEFIAIMAPNTRGRCHAVVMDGHKVIYDSARKPRRQYRLVGMGVIEIKEVK